MVCSTRQPARLEQCQMGIERQDRPPGLAAPGWPAGVGGGGHLRPSSRPARCTARLTASVLPGAARDRSPRQQAGTRGLVEIDEEALAYEQRGPAGVVPAAAQDAGHVVGPEVGGRQGQTCAGAGRRDGPEPPRLVGLGGRVVKLEEPHPGGTEPQGPVVVAGAADHDLARPAEIAPITWSSKKRVRARIWGRSQEADVGLMPRQSDSWASGSPSGLVGRGIPARTKATAWLVREGSGPAAEGAQPPRERLLARHNEFLTLPAGTAASA